MVPVNELARGYRLYEKEYNDKAISVLQSGWYILGKEVEGFEKEFAESLGDNCYCAGVDNGLNAIRLGLHACGITTGDEVIVQSNGYIATMLGITQNGGVPVFVEPDGYHNMDPDKIEAAITDKTKAVLVTHLYGQATRMEKIVEICKKHNLMLFEDCAQSHFASYRGTNTGLFGDAGFFSFYPTKNLGGFGDGGGVVSRNKELIERIKTYRNYGSDYKYHNIVLGFNSRLDEMQAGLLRIKLKHMPELLANRRKIADAYLAGIKNPLIRLPEIVEGATTNWYLFVINTEDQAGFRKYMLDHGVQTDVHFPTPPFLQPALSYLGHGEGSFPIAEKDCKTVVSLPMMDYMADDEIETVIRVVNAYEG
ncbi:MAG: DegT/DnrJ/EryC1/StrS family aminotransferase [Lachnospiraceae bacterium]|nr:DegT/DnrJ/EryC1/StrS family aminotransferase [Lachnospiraceae bacterium]